MVPHIARTLVGPDFGRLIPTAALLGGGFLLVIDTLARTVPFFVWLLAGVSKTWS